MDEDIDNIPDITEAQKREFNRIMERVRRNQTYSVKGNFIKERAQARKERSVELFDLGWDIEDIAEDVGVHKLTASGYIKAHKEELGLSD